APQRDWERVPPLLAGGLMRSILTGLPYPQGLYTALISRVRADQEVNYIRAAVIKAVLTRGWRFRWQKGGRASETAFQEVNLTVGLDERNTTERISLAGSLLHLRRCSR